MEGLEDQDIIILIRAQTMVSVLHGARSIVNYAPISTHCTRVLAAMILIIGLDGMGGTMDAVSFSREFNENLT